MNRIYKILLVAVIACSSNFAHTQTVVILNGVPTKVQLEGDKIVSILEEVPNYLGNGYENKSTEIKYGAKGNIIEGTVASTPTAAATLTTTSSVTKTTTTTTTTTTATTQTQSTSPIIGNYFKFSGNSALLSELSISAIKDYAKKIASGEASSVTLESFYQTDNARSEQLISNRLDACKKYFELSGVSSSQIKTNKIADTNQSNKVSVTLK